MNIKLFNEYISDINETNNNFYNETAWSRTIDGHIVTITIKDVENYLNNNNVGVTNILVDSIFDMCAHKDKTDKETLERSELSDLNFPIIISKDLNGEYNMILDGHHRLLKAKNHGYKTIKARILNLIDAPYEYKKMFK